jgi:hypothetical protein
MSSYIARLPQRRRRLLKTATRMIVLVATITATMAVGGIAVASASYISSNSGYANVRTCGATWCAAVATLRNGTGVNMTAWCDSSWATGNYSSPRWFKITSPVSGWIHSSLVAAQQSVGQNCYA